jgi:hypothetical protein
LKYALIIAFLAAQIVVTDAQTTTALPHSDYANANHAWFMYFGSHKLSKHWGLHLEAQIRRADFIGAPQQLLFRPGINYYINGQAFATFGYAFIETNPYGDQPVKATFPENRFWEQLQLKNQVGRFEWVSRFRLEQRFSKLPVQQTNLSYEPGDAIYTNRFRLLNRFSIPFKGKTIEDKSFYLSMYDELFVNFGKNVKYNIFDQNRVYLAIGYRMPKLGRLELGYLNQLIFKGDGIKVENNHTLQVGLY